MLKINKQRIGVYGLIINPSHEILLVKRSLHDSSPGVWEMPGGGLELGESPQSGVIREVQEESGLSVKIFYPLAILSLISRRDPTMQIIRIAYLCHLNPSEQTVSLSSEHSDFRWAPLSTDIALTPLSDLLQQTIKTLNHFPNLLTQINGR